MLVAREERGELRAVPRQGVEERRVKHVGKRVGPTVAEESVLKRGSRCGMWIRRPAQGSAPSAPAGGAPAASPGHKKPRTEDRTEKTENRSRTEPKPRISVPDSQEPKYSVRFRFFTRLTEEPSLLNI